MAKVGFYDVLERWYFYQDNTEEFTSKLYSNGIMYKVKTIFECFDVLYKEYLSARKTPVAHEIYMCLKNNLIEFVSISLCINRKQAELIVGNVNFADDDWFLILLEVDERYKLIRHFNRLETTEC